MCLCSRSRTSSRVGQQLRLPNLVQTGEPFSLPAYTHSAGAHSASMTTELFRPLALEPSSPRRPKKSRQKHEEVWEHPSSECVPCLSRMTPPLLSINADPFVVTNIAADDEARPTHLLRASMPKIKEFLATKLPPPPPKPVAVESEDTTMSNGDADAAAIPATNGNSVSVTA